MVVEFTHGQMVEATMESILRTKNKDSEYTNGPTVRGMKATGKTVNSTDKASSLTNKASPE